MCIVLFYDIVTPLRYFEFINTIHGYLHIGQVSGFEIISRHTFNRPGSSHVCTIDTLCSFIKV